MLKELVLLRHVCDFFGGLVWSIVGKFAEALDEFVNQDETQLVDRFWTGLENACTGSQLVYP